MTQILQRSLTIWLVAMAFTGHAVAQLRAPVDIASDPLPLKQQEQGVLRVRVTAIAAVERLEVSISGDSGVALEKPVPLAVFTDVKRGEQHVFPITVRLVSSDFGYVQVSAKTTTGGRSEFRQLALTVGTVPPPQPRTPVFTEEDLADLTLVKVSGRNAVVQFGLKPMVIVTVGDHLGRNKAELIEVSEGRIVLDETFIDPDGKPNRARVTLKEGEKGGTRVLLKPGEAPPPASDVQIAKPKPPGDMAGRAPL